MSSRSADDSEAIAVGRVLRAHGLRGEVRVEVLSDVEGRFDRDRELWLRPGRGPRFRSRIVGQRRDRGTLLIRFEGVDDRDRAEALRGAVIEVDPADVPPAPDDLYYHFELVGCECHDQRSGFLGEVSEVIEDGGGDMLVVRRDGRALLVPFVEAFVLEVDVHEKRRIDLRLPDGLVETCTSRS
jgi:16S rRNA processing protein RimM